MNVHLSPKHEEESASLPTESSTANNENISEGQWIITLLSDGEIPHNIPLDEGMSSVLSVDDALKFSALIFTFSGCR